MRFETVLFVSLLALSADHALGFLPRATNDKYTDVHWRQQETPLLERVHKNTSQTKRATSRRRVSVVDRVEERNHRLSDRENEIKQAQSAHGMPWRTSLSQTGDENLYYMPFWEFQLDFMKEHLSNLRVVPCTSHGSTQFPSSTREFDYKESQDGKSRIVSLCFRSDEFQKIRMTYYENGQKGQSFNSVFYPDPAYNVPMLGINLLSKSALNKHLAIIDYQPLFPKKQDHALSLEPLQKELLSKFPHLHQGENDRIWDLQVFSNQMLCKRFEDEDMVSRQIFPAFCDYVRAYIALLTHPDTKPDPSTRQKVTERQIAYDTYSSVRDPCTPLLGSIFGKEWAEEFVYGFLYSLSERKEESYWTGIEEE